MFERRSYISSYRAYFSHVDAVVKILLTFAHFLGISQSPLRCEIIHVVFSLPSGNFIQHPNFPLSRLTVLFILSTTLYGNQFLYNNTSLFLLYIRWRWLFFSLATLPFGALCSFFWGDEWRKKRSRILDCYYLINLSTL